jgi:hypothetical protein
MADTARLCYSLKKNELSESPWGKFFSFGFNPHNLTDTFRKSAQSGYFFVVRGFLFFFFLF